MLEKIEYAWGPVLVLRDPKVKAETDSCLLAAGVRVNSKNAEPAAAVFRAPIWAAAPALLPAEKSL